MYVAYIMLPRGLLCGLALLLLLGLVGLGRSGSVLGRFSGLDATLLLHPAAIQHNTL